MRQTSPAPPPSALQTVLQLFLSLMVVATLGFIMASWAQISTQPLPARDTPSQVMRLPSLFTPEVRHWSASIARWAATYDLDPLLVATVMQIESCGDPRAVSHAGARGLFQVMPYHFEDGENALDPETNARRGLGYLRQMLNRTDGDVRLALAAYNGGPARLQEPEAHWPRETRLYVHWGWGIYRDAQAGLDRSATLEEWLMAGGRHLCRQAHANLPLSPSE